MRNSEPKAARVRELREMLSGYREMTIEEVEAGDRADVQVELEGEIWRLEEELFDPRKRVAPPFSRLRDDIETAVERA